jgi:prepilin-type N-terminal cleavage/methylation domain-containing protein
MTRRADHRPVSPSSPPRRQRRRRAFTLLELVLVMLVLAVLFGMAAPSMSGFGAGREAQQTASQIVTLARWAREQAISEGRPHRLNFNPTEQTYWVTASYGATFERLGVDFGRDFTVPLGVQLAFETPQDGGLPYLEFLPTGRCRPGHVRVVSRDDQVTELACLSATEPLRVVTPEELQEASVR